MHMIQQSREADCAGMLCMTDYARARAGSGCEKGKNERRPCRHTYSLALAHSAFTLRSEGASVAAGFGVVVGAAVVGTAVIALPPNDSPNVSMCIWQAYMFSESALLAVYSQCRKFSTS